VSAIGARHSSDGPGLTAIVAGGDDYELCFTAPNAAREDVAAIGRDVAVPLARIGKITAEPGLVVRDERGMPLPALPHAFDHFRRDEAPR
jgi:thiamine-monophosphate kinase